MTEKPGCGSEKFAYNLPRTQEGVVSRAFVRNITDRRMSMKPITRARPLHFQSLLP